MISQEKGPPFPAARRWGLSPSRGNDASGRNDRVLPKMVKTSVLHHPLKSQADMRQVHPFDLESATLKSTPPMMVDARTSKLLKQIGFDAEAGFIFGFTSAMDD